MLLRRHSDSSDYGDGDRDNGLGDGVDDDGQRRPPPTHTVVDVLLFSQLSFMNHTGRFSFTATRIPPWTCTP